MSDSKNNVDRMIESMTEREQLETLEILQNSKNISYNTLEQVANEWVANEEEEEKERSKGKGWWR